MLRDYQQNAHDAVLDWVRQCIEPCLIEAPTGAGKSHIIAAIADSVHRISGGKKILCIAPSAELVVQNHEKYLATGNPASIYSASAGGKSMKHPVVFGTPVTIKNSIDKFCDKFFCLIVIDEAHGMTPTVRGIIDELREKNKNLRVVGLTATPYRLGSGYIYRMDEKNNPVPEAHGREPYFARLVYKISAHELIKRGYLTPPVVGEISCESYDTLNMQLNKMGQFNAADVDRAYHGQGRKTAAIVADIVARSRDRKGVLIFAATIRHALECLDSLPPELSAIVTGDTPKKERDNILKMFKAQRLKYLVNVAVLTTGFDAPHVDVIAMMRATESVGLMQQIIGRGLRIDDGKTDCLVLDYAQNVERHCPDADIFDPKIKAIKGGGGAEMSVICPVCNAENIFSARKNDEGFESDKYGYFVDLDGNRIETEHGDLPAHMGRRCCAQYLAPGGILERCGYRWTFKQCESCGHENDIAARYCANKECKQELVDPNEKLISDFKALKRDPTQIQCDEIIDMTWTDTLARSGRECIKADFTTPHRSFSVWYVKGVPGSALHKLTMFERATAGDPPRSVTYQKQDSGFYEVLAFNQPTDNEVLKNENPRLATMLR